MSTSTLAMLISWIPPVSFEKPEWLWLLALIPIMVIVSARAMLALEAPRRILAIALRCLVIIAVACCLAEMVYVKKSDKLSVIFLMDRSDSVKDLQQAQEEYLHEVSKTLKKPDDLVGMIDFARHAHLQQLPMKGGYIIPPGRLPEMDRRDRTDVASAIRLAMAMFPADTGKRIVLLSDGNDNMGDVLSEAATAQGEGITIDVVPLWYRHGREVYFDRMVAPTNAEDGDLVPLRMLLSSEHRTSGRIDIYHNGQLIELPPEYARVALQPGNNPFIVKVPVHGGGPQRFEARFIPDDPIGGDSIEENNYATAFSFVAGKSRVLVMSNDPAEDAALVDALRNEKIDVELRDATEGQFDMLELLNFSVIILANVPANTFTDEQQRALTHYVSSLGGGLIMTGGDEAYGAGGWIGSPVAEVMPVHFEIKHKRVIPRGALVVISHSCEIPRGNYWGTEVAKKSVDTISSRDYFGVLAYTWSPGGVNWEVPLQLATNKEAIKSRIDRMSIGDMPDFDSTMRMAVQGLKGTDAAQKHVIIISDGDPSPPATAVIADMVNNKITCSTIGIGYGSHVVEQTLRDISSRTGGRFYACRNPKTLPQIFVKESKVVRRPLISEETFTPQVQNAFSEVLAGIDPREPLPPLGGLVLTSPKAEAQVTMIRATTDGNDPVLAHWQAGLGKTVAFTSGYWAHWGGDWVAWPAYSKLWAQIVRWAMRQDAPANLDVFTRIEGTQGRVIVDAVDVDAGALNLLELPGVIIKPDQTTAPLNFVQTGPGHYEAVFDLDQTGQFIANIAVRDQGEFKGAMQTGISVPFSPEFRELATNEALLREIVELTGGRWLEDIGDPQNHDVFRHDFPPILAHQPVWDWTLAWLLLPLFLLDVAARRLASWLAFSIAAELIVLVVLLFGVGTIYSFWGALGTLAFAELVGWTIRFRYIEPVFDFMTHTVTALGQAGQRSSASLDQLKGVRKRVREDRLDDRPAQPAAPEPPRGRPAPSTRFDAGEPTGEPTEDLQEAMGGPEVGEQSPQQPRKPAADEPAPDDATSRLLRAKRRARKDLEDDSEPRP